MGRYHSLDESVVKNFPNKFETISCAKCGKKCAKHAGSSTRTCCQECSRDFNNPQWKYANIPGFSEKARQYQKKRKQR